MDGLKSWSFVYRSIVNDWRNRVCNHLLVYSFTNHATTNDGAVHHATSCGHELSICRATEYRTDDSGIHGVVWELL